MAKNTQSKRRTAAQWAEVVKRWKDSGLSSKDFAKREGLNARTLVWWSSELRRRGKRKRPARPPRRRSSAAFSEVRVVQRSTPQPAAPAAGAPASSIEVQSRSGRVVRAVGAVDREALATVLEVVESC